MDELKKTRRKIASSPIHTVSHSILLSVSSAKPVARGSKIRKIRIMNIN